MQILEKIYTKYFDSKDAAIQFIEKHARAHAQKLSTDARFGGAVEVLKRTLGTPAQVVCVYKNGIEE